MRNILSQESTAVLDQVARGDVLVAFDFDGTLAPLTEDRSQAAMRPSTTTLLRLVSLMYPCAVISGRSRADLLPRLDGVSLLGIVGNHGGEPGRGPIDRSLRNTVALWQSAMSPVLRGMPGVELEDKLLSIAVHYRRARPKAAVVRALRALADELSSARLVRGRCVLNLVPAEAPDKGAAVSHLLDRAGRQRALYVGDDTSDEHAFGNQRVAVGIRVGRTARSAARYYIPSQAHVDALLRALVRARRRADGLDERIEALERLMADGFARA
jgi:trehalose 6-phosphate phosphatase